MKKLFSILSLFLCLLLCGCGDYNKAMKEYDEEFYAEMAKLASQCDWLDSTVKAEDYFQWDIERAGVNKVFYDTLLDGCVAEIAAQYEDSQSYKLIELSWESEIFSCVMSLDSDTDFEIHYNSWFNFDLGEYYISEHPNDKSCLMPLYYAEHDTNYGQEELEVTIID